MTGEPLSDFKTPQECYGALEQAFQGRQDKNNVIYKDDNLTSAALFFTWMGNTTVGGRPAVKVFYQWKSIGNYRPDEVTRPSPDNTYDHAVFIFDHRVTDQEAKEVYDYILENFKSISGSKTQKGNYDWSQLFFGKGIEVSGASVVDASHIWAAGSEGIYFFDGSQWLLQERGEFSGIEALDASHVWAYGKSIHFFDGAVWTTQVEDSGAIADLDACAPDRAWACSGPTKQSSHEQGVLSFNGTEWLRGTSKHGLSLRSLAAPDPEHLWAIGDVGTIYFSSGPPTYPLFIPQETVDSANQTEHFSSVFALDGSHAWANTGSSVHYFDGRNWKELLSVYGSNDHFSFSWGTPIDSTHLWIIGLYKHNMYLIAGEHCTEEFATEAGDDIIGVRAISSLKTLVVTSNGSVYMGTRRVGY